MIITILKSFMFWKYRWINIKLDDGTRLHGILPINIFLTQFKN